MRPDDGFGRPTSEEQSADYRLVGEMHAPMYSLVVPEAQAEFIPFLLIATPSGALAQFFDGPVPVAGDRVELFCYDASPTEVKLKWRVVK